MAGKYLPVVFRKFGKEGDVIALFPTIPATADGYQMLSYMHLGQHGAASDDLPGYTVAAKPSEYEPLLRELTNVVGYTNLMVYKRVTRQMNDERIATARGIRQAHEKNVREQASPPRTRLDQLLDSVTKGQREVTIDVADYSTDQINRIIDAAKARGLHVSGSRRSLLIRAL